MGEPGFWDDPERAAKTNAEYARASRKLSHFRQLEQDAADFDLGSLRDQLKLLADYL